MSNFHLEVYKKVKEMEFSQWNKRDRISSITNSYPILTKQQLQKIPINKDINFVRTSGSTGEPVYVQKYQEQMIWFVATNIRELLWRKWDLSKSIAIITAGIKEESIVEWKHNPYLFNKTGIAHSHPVIGNLQEWLDRVKPTYLHSYPSIISTLDTSGITDIKSTGERGATCYSSEELGTIAIECPDNPEVYHVMENIVIEIDDDGNIIATDLTHPYIKRYMLGDKGEFSTCNCGRGLQTIKKDVIGRVRNMVVYPDGSKAWPMFGTVKARDIATGIQRMQGIQTDINNITIKIQGDVPEEAHPELIKLAQDSLSYPFNIKIEIVKEFPIGKFEEFISRI